MEEEGTDNLPSRLEKLNSLVTFLTNQKINQLPFTQQPDCRDKNNLQKLYIMLTQCHLRRLLCLVEAMQDAWNNDRLFPCSILGRIAMESAATMVSINEQVSKYISAKNYDRAYFWIASHVFSTKLENLPPPSRGINFKSLNIMDAIRAAEKLQKGFEGHYDWLSEFLHPNSLGVFASFSEVVDTENERRVKFMDAQKVTR